MATLPTRAIEIEFDAGVWTDVSSDFVELGSRRGRNRESGAFETGKLTLRLRNDTRKYDPDHTTGPYYGKLRPNRRVRFRATYNAVTYPVIQGYIDRITQEYEGPNAASATFDVSDLFKLLNRAELPISAWEAELRADAPIVWYRLGAAVGSTVLVEQIAGRNATLIGSPTLDVDGLVTRDDDGAIQTTAATQGADSGLGSTILTAPPLTLALIVKGASLGSANGLVLADVSGPIVELGSNGSNAVGNVRTTVSNYAVTGTANIADGNPHLIVLTITAGGVIQLYTDGATDGASNTLSGSLVRTPDRVWIAGGQSWSSGVQQGLVGILDEAAVFNTAVAAARIAAWHAARATPWNGDLPGTRLGRILDQAAVPAADRNLDAGTTTLQASSLGGTALAYAQKVEETEAGELFVARDGKVRFLARNSLVTGTYLTSQATLVDDDSGAGIPYRQSGAEVDEAFIVTRATVSREGSEAITFYDTAAKTEFGWLDETHDGLLHDTDAYSLAYAQWIVNTHKAPSTWVGEVTLELTKDPVNMYPAILALELGDRVTYKRKPQNTGAVISLPMRVEAISHETGPHYWRTRLLLSPFDIAGYPVGVWDTGLWDQAVWGI